MAILKAGKLEKDMESHKLVSCLTRGGLWCITKPAENIFFHTECYLRNSFWRYKLKQVEKRGRKAINLFKKKKHKLKAIVMLQIMELYSHMDNCLRR